MSRYPNRRSYLDVIHLLQLIIAAVIIYRGERIYEFVPDTYNTAIWLGAFIVLYFFCLRTATLNFAGSNVTERMYYSNGSYSHRGVSVQNQWEAKTPQEAQELRRSNGGFSPLVFAFYQALVSTIYCMYIFQDYGWNMWLHVIGGLIGFGFIWQIVTILLKAIGDISKRSIFLGFIVDTLLVSGATASVFSIIMYFWHHN